MPIRISVDRSMFEGGKPRTVAIYPGITVQAQSFSTGVPYLSIENQRGIVQMLKMGSQIWYAEFDSKPLGMLSTLPNHEPPNFTPSLDFKKRSDQYLENYGALLVHCGPHRMGCPDRPEDHPLHGSLPLMSFNDPVVLTGTDSKGHYVEIRCISNNPITIGEGFNYTVKVATRIYAHEALVHTVTTTINNLATPTEFMFLEHANHRLVDGSRIIYSPALNDLVIREKDPGHIAKLLAAEQEHYRVIKTSFAQNPQQHTRVDLSRKLYPEIVLYGKQIGDQAIAAQVRLEDLSADVTIYDPRELPLLAVWMRQATEEQANREGFVVTNSLGLLPATGKPQGVNDARRDGEIGKVEREREVHCTVGLLNENELRARVPNLDELLK